ncbi:MFS transporter [Olivibacter sp. XZL3]|uniref:MFS transporter n=1 Tax=Olivibacter sp. XZL3 TaxID=1735116 RepID=UPI001064F8CD|nr:MFS transporter [Olivibacter sp. XZL3]
MKNSSFTRLSQRPSVVIANYVLLTFYGYFSIGLTLAVLPIFIHQQLGFNTIIAGAVISIQYVMTFIMRAYAGHVVDSKGPKPAVIASMSCFLLTGILLIASFSLADNPILSLSMLVVSRLTTGCGEGMVGASPVNWAMLRMGEEHTATAISYNGIANYSSMAIGAPLGVWMAGDLGNWSLGVLTIVAGLIGLFSALKKPALKSGQDAPRKPFLKVLSAVSPYGSGLALAGIGFGTLSTFITLYYAFNKWNQAAICITAFSLFFVLGRLLFARSIHRFGGIQVAIVCMAVESLGLLLLWLASDPHMAVLGASFTGLGFSLVFPALGVVAVSRASASNKGAALGAYGLFIDISLGITGPLVGLVAKGLGMNYIFPFSMSMVIVGLIVCFILKEKAREEAKLIIDLSADKA